MRPEGQETKKQMILDVAAGLGVNRYTPAEVEQIRRQLVVRLGETGKTSPEYIADVLKDAGLRVRRATAVDTEGIYEEWFQDLLHFSTFEEAEMCLVRLDELLRKFRGESNRAAVARVMEVARLGRRRTEMIARNPRVDRSKRAEKLEMVQWFRIWLETPEAFFDWLEVRKQSPEYQRSFGSNTARPAEREE